MKFALALSLLALGLSTAKALDGVTSYYPTGTSAIPFGYTLQGQVVRSLDGQHVGLLPGQTVAGLPGQIVQPLPGQIVRSLPGQLMSSHPRYQTSLRNSP